MNFRNDEDLIQKAGDLARDIHLEGYHCTETLIRALWPLLLPNEELTDSILRMTMVLHGGMADSMSSHCGGLTTGILIIGALYGRADIQGDARFAPAIARRYWQAFLDEFETSHCTTLKNGQPSGEAPTRCGCIMVRSARLLVKCLQELDLEHTSKEVVYDWKVNRVNEPCHEQIPPMKSSEEIKAEKAKQIK
jgi:hypothetical protein